MRRLSFHYKPPETVESPLTCASSGESSLSGRSLMSPNFSRERAYCFTWSPIHEELPHSLGAWLFEYETTRSAQTDNWTPDAGRTSNAAA